MPERYITEMRPAAPMPLIIGTRRDQEIRARLAYDAALDAGMGHDEATDIADRYRGSLTVTI